MTAVALSGVARALGPRLLTAHAHLCAMLLRAAHIPILGSATVAVIDGLGQAVVPTTPDPLGGLYSTRFVALFLLTCFALVLVHRLVSLARNFVAALLTLVVMSAATLMVTPSLRYTSILFTQIWLRGEVLVWFLLPWVTAILFMPIQPSWPKIWAWMIGVQVYGFLWSAVRLAFCLGVISFTGSLLTPVLWFLFGMLADLTYIAVAYSLVVHQAAGRWGDRRQWQY